MPPSWTLALFLLAAVSATKKERLFCQVCMDCERADTFLYSAFCNEGDVCYTLTKFSNGMTDRGCGADHCTPEDESTSGTCFMCDSAMCNAVSKNVAPIEFKLAGMGGGGVYAEKEMLPLPPPDDDFDDEHKKETKENIRMLNGTRVEEIDGPPEEKEEDEEEKNKGRGHLTMTLDDLERIFEEEAKLPAKVVVGTATEDEEEEKKEEEKEEKQKEKDDLFWEARADMVESFLDSEAEMAKEAEEVATPRLPPSKQRENSSSSLSLFLLFTITLWRILA